jgi:hypothetical protein
VGGREVEDVEGTIGHCFLGLVGVMIFMFGGSLVIWALPTASLPGLFLTGLGILLILWSGPGLPDNAQIVLSRDDKHEESEGTVSVWLLCPNCNAGYFYRLPDIEDAFTVTYQNCGHQFEVDKSLDASGATR